MGRWELKKSNGKVGNCQECERDIPKGETYWSLCSNCKVLCLPCFEIAFNSVDKTDLEQAKMNATENKL